MGCSHSVQLGLAQEVAESLQTNRPSDEEHVQPHDVEMSCFYDSWEVLHKIGKGAFAQVHRVQHRETGETAAVKIAEFCKPGEPIDEDAKAALLSEISIMRKVVKSEFCVGAKYAYTDDTLCYIIMPIADTSFPKALDQMDVTESSLRMIFRDMLLGLQHVHGVGIVHRDVKPDNFLCTMGHSGVPDRVRLCDFGLSARLQCNSGLRGVFGTAPFMSPEMVRDCQYNEKTDLWSLGVIVFVLLTGLFPYMPSEQTSDAMKTAIRTGGTPEFNPIVPALRPSEEAESFCSTLLCRCHKARPCASEMLESSFLAPHPPPGKKWCMNSLRTMVRHAKKIGALSVREKFSLSSIDQVVRAKQGHRTLGTASEAHSSVGQAPSVDSLPSIWSNARARKYTASVSSTADTLCSTPSMRQNPHKLHRRDCKAKTVDGLPSMVKLRSGPAMPLEPDSRLSLHKQAISHCVMPVDRSTVINMDDTPAITARPRMPTVSFAPSASAPARPMSRTSDALPSMHHLRAAASRSTDLRPASRQGRTNDSLPSFGKTTSFRDESTTDSLPSLPSKGKDPLASKAVSTFTQSTLDSLPRHAPTGRAQSSTSGSLPDMGQALTSNSPANYAAKYGVHEGMQ